MSREKILDAIRRNKPDAVALPQPAAFIYETNDLVAAFTESVRKAGGEVVMIRDISEIPGEINKALPGMQRTADLVNKRKSDYTTLLQDPEKLEVVILQGRLGVAENGAIWLSEEDCVERVLPFITQHLALMIRQDSLVGNMHEAYAKMASDVIGYGVFIAGPSKTADIEQSLVIGAHGAKSLLVFMIQ